MKIESDNQTEDNHPIHTIMSRTGSFPLPLAYDLLKQHGSAHCTVLDVFCGKGTSLLAARLLGFRALGIDIAHEAVICSIAKMLPVEKESVIDYVSRIKIDKPSLKNVPPKVKVFFDSSTLIQILSIRNKLFRDIESKNLEIYSNSMFTLAALLGIFHGHASYSLSLPCSHAYSMSSNYVKNYAEKNNLVPPKRDVKECLIKKIGNCLKFPPPSFVEYKIKQGCASSCDALFPEYNNKVDIVLTSPPYLNAQTYAKDNWLRLWLLGHDYKAVNKGYIQTSSIEKYRDFIHSVFSHISKLLKNNGILICIAGDVRRTIQKDGIKTTKIFKTGKFLANLIENDSLGFKIYDIQKHTVPSKFRYFHSLNNSNGHYKRDLIERTFIARKI